MTQIDYAYLLGNDSGNGDMRAFGSSDAVFRAVPVTGHSVTLAGSALVTRVVQEADPTGQGTVIMSCQDANVNGYRVGYEIDDTREEFITLQVMTSHGAPEGITTAFMPGLVNGKQAHVVWLAAFDTNHALYRLAIWVNRCRLVNVDIVGGGTFLPAGSGSLFVLGGTDPNGMNDGGLGLNVSAAAMKFGALPGDDSVATLFDAVQANGTIAYNDDPNFTWDHVWTAKNASNPIGATWAADHGGKNLSYLGLSSVEKRTNSTPMWL